MIEKIKKLAEQAGGFPLYPDRTEGDETFAFRERALKRFVDMIMEECCSAIQLDDVINGGKFQQKIRQHFGVGNE